MNFGKLFLLFLIFAFKANAENFQENFQDWTVFKANDGGEVLCYMISTPIAQSKTIKKRGDAFLIVTNVKNDADEISASSGVLYNEKSDVEISFGKRKYYLLPYKSRAWAYDKNDDIEIIKQMQKQPDMIISASSDADENINDTYSLVGFAPAYIKMKKICKN